MTRRADTLFVGVNTFGIAGDADGNGDPGGADPLTTASGGIDLPHMGADKSIAVAIAAERAPGIGHVRHARWSSRASPPTRRPPARA